MSEAETEDGLPDAESIETDPEEAPESVSDDWLDPKPFDPAGR